MNWADISILAILGVSALLSLQRGFVKEAMSLATWVAAFLIARFFSNSLSMLLADYISIHSTRKAASFVILFVATLIVGALVSHLIKELVKVTGLSSTDRLLGMVFGAVRGGMVVLVIVATLHWLDMFALDPWWQESVLIPHFVTLEDWTRENAQAMLSKF